MTKPAAPAGDVLPFRLPFKLWHAKSDPNGERISREKKDSIGANPGEFELLIIRDTTLTEVFVNGRPSDPPPGRLAYLILSYVLKHRGTGGTAWNIAKHVYDIEEVAGFQDLGEMARALKSMPDLEQAKLLEKRDQLMHYDETFSKRVNQRIVAVNKYFRRLGLETSLEADRTLREYELTPSVNYCLIEKI